VREVFDFSFTLNGDVSSANMTVEKRTRAFLALDLPSHIRQKIARIQKHLKQSLRRGIRWTHPDSVHLTLKFFGTISATQIATVSAVVSGIAAATPPLALQLGTPGAFPGLKRPRVIWLGIQGDAEPLLRLQQQLDANLLCCGFGKEKRPFRPHLTVGRAKTLATISGLDAFVAAAASEFTARELVLFKSELTPRGSIHTPLAIFPLAALK
jgi:2'-5' RNA ligase